MTDRAEQARTADVVRQVVVLVGAVVAIAGAFLGSGAAGPDQTEVGDGALSPEATLVAPASPAFSIWSVIYTGLTAWAIWQVLPSQRARTRQRRLGWLLLASLLLNAAWIAVVQAGLLGASVPVIVLLLAVLIAMAIRLRRPPAESWWDRVLMDGTTGLYLGWVCVATIANVAAVLTSAGYDELGLGGTAWGVIVLAVAGALAVALALWMRNPAPALAIGWGVAWVAVARSAGEPESATVATAAGVVSVVAVVAAVLAVARSVRGARAGA